MTCDRRGCGTEMSTDDPEEGQPFGFMRRVGMDGSGLPIVCIYCSRECVNLDREAV